MIFMASWLHGHHLELSTLQHILTRFIILVSDKTSWISCTKKTLIELPKCRQQCRSCNFVTHSDYPVPLLYFICLLSSFQAQMIKLSRQFLVLDSTNKLILKCSLFADSVYLKQAVNKMTIFLLPFVSKLMEKYAL